MHIQYSASFRHIDVALKSLWQPSNELFNEINNFVPRSISDYENQREEMLEKWKVYNKNTNETHLVDFVNSQIESIAKPKMQLIDKFSDRLMNQYITVIFLSHALCEAVINAILAIGLAKNNSEELFSILEKADLKQKWLIGPKSFSPSYNLDKDQAIYETLSYLIKQRNAIVHYKIKLEGSKHLRGSDFKSETFKDCIKWLRRFFSLPYDLDVYCYTMINDSQLRILYNRFPIERCRTHRVEDPWYPQN